MTEKPSLDANSLDSYIKCKEYDDEKYEIRIYLSSSDTGFAFVVGMRVKEPHTEGAFPQKRITLEQHDEGGHEGVHVQIHYHAIDNAMDAWNDIVTDINSGISPEKIVINTAGTPYDYPISPRFGSGMDTFANSVQPDMIIMLEAPPAP